MVGLPYFFKLSYNLHSIKRHKFLVYSMINFYLCNRTRIGKREHF